jgi:hypothetical protein
MLFVYVGATHERIETVCLWQSIVVLALVTPMTAAVRLMPTPAGAGLLVVMGAIFTLGLWLVTAALRMGEATALAPPPCLRRILVGGAGQAVYAETPKVQTVARATLVLTAATDTRSGGTRSGRSMRQARTPAPSRDRSSERPMTKPCGARHKPRFFNQSRICRISVSCAFTTSSASFRISASVPC